ncbi:MAG: hypothetical protein QOJ63_3647, partial [Solirubrobacteraceae bacterium]|nr:hypothetical protein [Solirubrobacteraceae bacterium]
RRLAQGLGETFETATGNRTISGAKR